MQESGITLQRQMRNWIENDQHAVEFRCWAAAAQADGYNTVANHLARTAESLELITQSLSTLLEELDGPLLGHPYRRTRTPERTPG